jgi:non-lysosomal glucosylceramidase
MELRADGTIHEVTVMNASPAGAAKFGVLADMLLAVRTSAPSGAPMDRESSSSSSSSTTDTVTKLVRTQPPGYAPAAVSGVDAIQYSGSYPVSRLQLLDTALPVQASIFAFSKLVPGDPEASALPAIAFTVVITNPTSAPVNVSFLATLPLPAINDCARSGTNVSAVTAAANASQCLNLCSAAGPLCASWTYSPTSPLAAGGNCTLNRDVPLSVFSAGAFCGVSGSWAVAGDGALLWMQSPEGGAGGPANGDATLNPVSDGGTATSVGVSDDPAVLLAAFAAGGSLAQLAPHSTSSSAAIGGATATKEVPAGGSATLSIVFAWYFPDRDHMGANIGNFYSTLFDSSLGAAQTLDSEAALAQVVADIDAHHRVFVGTVANAAAGTVASDSILPEWLADAAINQMSHFRGMIWTRDGRMREFEAFDCPDVDSVHNDYQRHLPYLWLLPEFELQKSRIYAAGQASDGHIWEYLGAFALSPLDQWGGRVMGEWVVCDRSGATTCGRRTSLRTAGRPRCVPRCTATGLHRTCCCDV